MKNSHLYLRVIVILCAALCARLVFTSISPLQELIQTDLYSNYQQLGLLASLPQLSSGIFSLSVPFLLQRVTSITVSAIGLTLITVLGAAILIQKSHLPFYLIVVTVGSGMALLQIALLSVVKQYYVKKQTQMIAAIVACMHLGSAIAAISTLSIAQVLDGWRYALLFYATFVFVILFFWLIIFGKTPANNTHYNISINSSKLHYDKAKPPYHLLRNASTWWLVAYFISSGVVYVSLLTWLPNYRIFHGGTLQQGGNFLTLFVVFQALAAITLSLIGNDKQNKQKQLIYACLLCLFSIVIVYLFQLSLLPRFTSMIYLFPILIGLGLGASFAISMTLPGLYGKNHHETAFISMMAMGIGGTLCAPAPYLIGYLHDMTDNPLVSIWVVFIAIMLMLFIAPKLKQ